MAHVLESQIEKKVCAYAKRKGWLVYKFTSPGKRSVPDRIFIGDRKMFFIEFKAPGKKPTKLQLAEHAKIQSQGFIVWIIDDIDKGKTLIDTLS